MTKQNSPVVDRSGKDSAEFERQLGAEARAEERREREAEERKAAADLEVEKQIAAQKQLAAEEARREELRPKVEAGIAALRRDTATARTRLQSRKELLTQQECAIGDAEGALLTVAELRNAPERALAALERASSRFAKVFEELR